MSPGVRIDQQVTKETFEGPDEATGLEVEGYPRSIRSLGRRRLLEKMGGVNDASQFFLLGGGAEVVAAM